MFLHQRNEKRQGRNNQPRIQHHCHSILPLRSHRQGLRCRVRHQADAVGIQGTEVTFQPVELIHTAALRVGIDTLKVVSVLKA